MIKISDIRNQENKLWRNLVAETVAKTTVNCRIKVHRATYDQIWHLNSQIKSEVDREIYKKVYK